MKKKLLYFTSIVLFSVSAINAQTTVWDFGNNTSSVNGGAVVTTDWPLGTGIGSAEIAKSNLGLFPISTNTNFGAITAGAASAGQFSDGYLAPNRFQANGAGYATGASAATPTQRYLHFNVDGAATVRVWFKGGNTSSTRSEIVSDNVTVLGQAASVNGVATLLSVSLPAAGKYYIYGDAANNLYKVEVSGANVTAPTLATDNFQAESSVAVYANDGKINVSNVTSSTSVNVYSVLGSLVKSATISEDTSLDINNGVYIVKAQSAEGTKTAKVIVQ